MYKPGYATVGNFLEPRITSEDEVKIRVHYCAINSDDYSMYMGKLKSRYASYGLLNEFSGVITQVGSASESAGFSERDHVFPLRHVPYVPQQPAGPLCRIEWRCLLK